MNEIVEKAMTKPVTRRVLLIGDTTLDPVARMLERSADLPLVQANAAPFGQIYQILLNPEHPAWMDRPDVVVVWTAPHLTLPSVAKLLRFEFSSATAVYDQAMLEVDEFADAVLQAASQGVLVYVPAWILPAYERWVQILSWPGEPDCQSRSSPRRTVRFAAERRLAGYAVLAGKSGPASV